MRLVLSAEAQAAELFDGLGGGGLAETQGGGGGAVQAPADEGEGGDDGGTVVSGVGGSSGRSTTMFKGGVEWSATGLPGRCTSGLPPPCYFPNPPHDGGGGKVDV